MKHATRFLAILLLAVPATAFAAPRCKVVITPTEGTTLPDGSFEFKAKVEPASCSQTLIWSASEGMIKDGDFHAPFFGPSDEGAVKNVTITAKQVDSPHAKATALVKVADGKTFTGSSSKVSSSSRAEGRRKGSGSSQELTTPTRTD